MNFSTVIRDTLLPFTWGTGIVLSIILLEIFFGKWKFLENEVLDRQVKGKKEGETCWMIEV